MYFVLKTVTIEEKNSLPPKKGITCKCLKVWVMTED